MVKDAEDDCATNADMKAVRDLLASEMGSIRDMMDHRFAALEEKVDLKDTSLRELIDKNEVAADGKHAALNQTVESVKTQFEAQIKPIWNEVHSLRTGRATDMVIREGAAPWKRMGFVVLGGVILAIVLSFLAGRMLLPPAESVPTQRGARP